ncbi:MAG TPA: signal peptidase I [Candidatus Dormibacteraeota bacterium]|nr:signal peptidase I [Candidatus Dormibacteraeota bacterium]
MTFEITPTPGNSVGPAPSRSKRGARLAVEIVETLVLTALIFLGIQTFVAQPFRVEGVSMEATLAPDEYVLVDKLTPRWAPYKRGDVVVLDPPAAYQRGGGTPFIKRVIGVGGDHIQLVNGVVLVNGAALDEPYVYADNGVRQPTDPLSGLSEWVVPQGQLFVLGDHRGDSSDSRVFGTVDVSSIVGRAWLRYWPVNTFGALPAPTYSAASAAP